MVHTLQEVHRVLKAAGTLIDLRPTAQNRTVELELSYARLNLGEIDSSSRITGCQAADDALRGAVNQGLFRGEHDANFQLITDLDTAADLRAYAATWRRSILPQEIVKRLEALTAHENEDFIIRIRRGMLIARYRKMSAEARQFRRNC